jgi:hypothetical protein
MIFPTTNTRAGFVLICSTGKLDLFVEIRHLRVRSIDYSNSQLILVSLKMKEKSSYVFLADLILISRF